MVRRNIRTGKYLNIFKYLNIRQTLPPTQYIVMPGDILGPFYFKQMEKRKDED